MTSFLNWAEPVTLVRSPILTKLPLGRIVMSGGDHHRLDAGEAGPARRRGDRARREAGDRLGDSRDMRRRSAAAAADDVDDALLGPFADLRRGRRRTFVIVAEIVGQAGI